MNDLTPSNSQYSLTPLGAGDLIDRAVRFYRKNFWTFVWIAAPPIVAGTLISVGWRILARSLFSIDPVNNPGETYAYYFFLWLGNLLIWLVEVVVTFTVMGGASRNFVRHLLFGEPITFRETYRNVKSRVFGLLTASVLIALLLGFIGMIILSIGYTVAALSIALTIYTFSFSPFIATILSIALFLGVAFGTGWLFFLIATNFAYVPQAMLVEGQGVFPAMGRSATLARGKALRLYALFVFSIIAIYSGLMLLKIPLDWYAWANGIDVWRAYFAWEPIPAWYEIASQFIWQASLILLMPVSMIGLCLMYVDERVRHEGYDIELLAAQRLGEIPAVPREFVNPLHPALAAKTYVENQPPNLPPPAKKASHSMLGLD
ncbi:MAG: hypothetical protein JSS81_04880 [Acidobacteria bacterium]|nr:hypothetical protein [Acidobacteriota bacterium]